MGIKSLDTLNTNFSVNGPDVVSKDNVWNVHQYSATGRKIQQKANLASGTSAITSHCNCTPSRISVTCSSKTLEETVMAGKVDTEIALFQKPLFAEI